MNRTFWIAAVSSCLALAACGGDDAEAEADTAGEEAASEPASPPPAGALGVPLAEVGEDEIRSSLGAGGWEVRSVSTSGAFLTVLGMKDDTRATISYQNPTRSVQRGYIEQGGGAVEVEGEVLLGVTVADDPELSQQMLDAMLGR